MNRFGLCLLGLICFGCAGDSSQTDADAAALPSQVGVASSVQALNAPCEPGGVECRDTAFFVCNDQGEWENKGVIFGNCGVQCHPGEAGCGTGSDICWGANCGSKAGVGAAIPTYSCGIDGKVYVDDYCASYICKDDGSWSLASCAVEGNYARCSYTSRCDPKL